LYSSGRHAEADQHFADALEPTIRPPKSNPDYAELLFRQAVCELALDQTNTPLAETFSLARDHRCFTVPG
jgi:hypothetical protein